MEEDQEATLSMLDVLAEEKELEEDADAVLGASDDQHCTYNQGYMKRQALYACMTCTPPSSVDFKPAGVCLACSLHCHENHELVELYTKRNFRCDCGNQKFPGSCSLEKMKDAQNEGNSYNQNFSGVYCTCNRPYPDPDDSVDDVMIQCVVCEDWYHSRHLDNGDAECDVDSHPDDFSEMICGDCVRQLPFLTSYFGLQATFLTSGKKSESEVESANVNVHDVSSELMGNVSTNVEQTGEAIAESSSGENKAECSVSCKLAAATGQTPQQRAFFINGNLRDQLCRCEKCKDLYSSRGVTYLLDEEDTVKYYEAKGKSRIAQRSSDNVMEVLSGMGRVQQVEAIHEFNSLKSELMNYLKDFATNDKVVRKEDIQEFFTELRAKKRRRVEIPFQCK